MLEHVFRTVSFFGSLSICIAVGGRVNLRYYL